MSEPTLFDLWKATAEKLAGCKVILKFQQPSRRDADGQLTRLANGRALIELNPDVSQEKLLFNFLHELAHVRLHWGDLLEIDPRQAKEYKPKSLVKPAYLPDYPRQEIQANTLANKWLKYSETNWRRFLPGSEEVCKLLALLEVKT